MVGIALRHHRRLVPEQPLHLVQFHTSLNQSRGKGMPEIVEMKVLDPGLLQRQPERSPKMATFDWRTSLAPKYQVPVILSLELN